MRVADRIPSSVVFIGTYHRGDFTPLGTGFYVLKIEDGFQFQHIVTARHVIENLDVEDIYIRGNLKGDGIEVHPTKKNEWMFHPGKGKNQYIDVAVLPSHVPPERFDLLHMSIEREMVTPEIISDEGIGIGDEIFTVGLFTNHYGQARNIPVVRSGIISAMPSEPMYTEYGFMNGYLVETHSLGGVSGSPVFVQMAPLRVIENEVRQSMKMTHYFLGLISGHWTVQNPEDAIAETTEPGVTGRINTGISIVVPAQDILETVNQPILMDKRKKIAQAQKEKAKGSFSFDVAPTAARKKMDETLRKMLNTPPSPHEKKPKK